jgi:hypothetical protein
MLSRQPALVALSFLASLAIASPFSPSVDLKPRSSCSGNTASTRSEWCDYSIDTDYTSEVPETGVTKEYWLELTDVTVAPDGVSRSAMAVNVSRARFRNHFKSFFMGNTNISTIDSSRPY